MKAGRPTGPPRLCCLLRQRREVRLDVVPRRSDPGRIVVTAYRGQGIGAFAVDAERSQVGHERAALGGGIGVVVADLGQVARAERMVGHVVVRGRAVPLVDRTGWRSRGRARRPAGRPPRCPRTPGRPRWCRRSGSARRRTSCRPAAGSSGRPRCPCSGPPAPPRPVRRASGSCSSCRPAGASPGCSAPRPAGRTAACRPCSRRRRRSRRNPPGTCRAACPTRTCRRPRAGSASCPRTSRTGSSGPCRWPGSVPPTEVTHGLDGG